MDQIKIGMFIAELRKEQGMTQKQLAENIGVSDKTISKWECGNGLPEMSSIPVLCEALGINMNELLSGERLAEKVYSAKAEENMLTLMKETEVHKKKSKTSFVTLVLCLTGCVISMILTLGVGIGYSDFWFFLDVPTLMMLLLPTLLILVASGLLKSFFMAFRMLGKGGNRYTKEERKKANLALRLGGTSLMTVGGVEFIATMILIIVSYRQEMPVEQFLANTAIASLGILYGAAAYLLLLPIRYKLEAEMEEKN